VPFSPPASPVPAPAPAPGVAGSSSVSGAAAAGGEGPSVMQRMVEAAYAEVGARGGKARMRRHSV
jgi:hypothetical protein